MKLYVWEDVLCDYTCGMAFALAETEDEAIEIIAKREGLEEYIRGQLASRKPTVHEPTDKVGYAVYGGG
jgi:hypothetical protein